MNGPSAHRPEPLDLLSPLTSFLDASMLWGPGAGCVFQILLDIVFRRNNQGQDPDKALLY